MAFERLEKYKRSLRDFKRVKHLEPGNLQSSQGIRRVQQCCDFDNEVLSDSEPEPEIVLIEEIPEKPIQKNQDSDNQENKKEKEQDIVVDKIKEQMDRLGDLKEEGNKCFLQKDLEGALKKFKEVAFELEVHYTSQMNKNEERVVQLYLQVLSNSALCYLTMNKYEEVIKCCTSALFYKEDNIKCLYRRAQAYRQLGDAIVDENSLETLRLKYDNYERARKDLEKVNKMDATNKMAKNLLQDVSKLGIQIKLALRHKETEQQNQKNQEDQSEEKFSEKKSENSKHDQSHITSNLTTSDLNKLTEKALQTATENFVNEFKLPENATVFEVDYQHLKNQNDRLYRYIKNIPAEHYAKIYDKNDIPSSILLAILRVLKEFGVNEDKQMCQNILIGLTQTAKFSLCIKFITKKEKLEIKELIEMIDTTNSSNLLEIFKI